MTELKTTQPSVPSQRAQELQTSGGPVELSFDQMTHVAGGGVVISEDLVANLPETNGFLLSE